MQPTKQPLIIIEGKDCEVCQLVSMVNNHNLSESSKIEIAEGYYE